MPEVPECGFMPLPVIVTLAGDGRSPGEKRMADVIKRIDRKFVKKLHVLDYYEDTIETPEGHIAKWDFLKHNGAAAVVPVREDGKILLVRQYRNAVDRFSLEIPAGKKDDPGESGLSCAKRELEEETGYRSENLTLLVKLVTAIAYCNETIDIFVARDLVPVGQHLDDDEYIDVQPFDPELLKEMVFSGKIQDAKTVAALMAYFVRQQDT